MFATLRKGGAVNSSPPVSIHPERPKRPHGYKSPPVKKEGILDGSRMRTGYTRFTSKGDKSII
jgi:hypothetical protein